MSGNDLAVTIRAFIAGIGVKTIIISSTVIMAAGMLENIRRARAKDCDSRQKKLNIISAAVLLLPIALVVLFLVVL
ncbi:hypothetical protein [uncultured Ruminococcus sp.]|uniref:hypothetical protein n=1 Tax=uncultured Ruminococcus sp. TaxID=165186 RepID=UPI0025E1C814|nr:hypothetical protein [uncultured Ruminococcus sp.]